MQVKLTSLSDTETRLNITATEKELVPLKEHTLTHFQAKIKLPGFREGKAPLSLVEKQVEPAQLQSEFLEEAIQQLYVRAIEETKLRPVNQPQVELKKFVPYTTLEFEVQVES